MQLVPAPIPADLEQASRDIADGVQSGDIVGLGVVVQLRDGNFFVDVLGRMTRRPWDARGWLLSLDDYLREIGDRRRHTPSTR